jgi:hypothetical protein
MKQEVKPTYASFEFSKWLKSKRFNLSSFMYYDNGGCLCSSPWHVSNQMKLVVAPEQWQVVEWLETNHRIIVTIIPDNEENFFETEEVIYIPLVYLAQKGLHNIYKSIVRDKDGNSIASFKTRQEATSAAFDYIKHFSLIQTQ